MSLIKVLYLAFILVHQVTCVVMPFSENSIIIASVTTVGSITPPIQLSEFFINGTLIQTIPLTGYVAGLRAQMALDQNGQILAVPALEGTSGQTSVGMPRVVLTMNSEGTIVDKTSISGVDPLFNAIGINGQDLWIGLNTDFSYTTRGSTSKIVDEVISSNNGYESYYSVYTAQVLGDAMYLGVKTSSPYPLLWKMDTIPTSIGDAVQLDQDTGTLYTECFYVYSSSVVYIAVNGFNRKFTVGATLHEEYKVAYSAGGQVQSMVARQVGSQLFVFLLQSNGKVTRWTDTGSEFTEELDIAAGVFSSGQPMSLAFSPQPTCSDSMLNQDETDVDCGGSKCSACADDKKCSVNGDCSSSFCNPNNKCSTPTCSDGWKNQDETDVDCGGATCTNKCADGKVCNGNTDCVSKVCSIDGLCAVPACDDTVMNGIETDVDCGGDCTTKCAESKSCLIDGDCLSKNCLNNVCEMSCFDGFKNQNETDIDCGGVCGATCDNLKSCERDGDCLGGYCNPEAVCSDPTCSDGWMNQDETDVDCGGSCVTLCLNGKNCKVDADCQSGSCNSVCVNPPASTPTDVSSPTANNEPMTLTPSTGSIPVGSRTPRGTLVSSASVFNSGLMTLVALLSIFI